MSETQALAEFGKKYCDCYGFGDFWVQFKVRGYPSKLRREWDDCKGDADKTWAIMMRYVEAWNWKDVDGNDVPITLDRHATDNMEDAVTLWIGRAFYNFWLVELPSPSPNS